MIRLVLLLNVLTLTKVYSQSIDDSVRISNIETFSKLYGYVRWFHPSSEASKVDWNKFAVWGCKSVMDAKNSDQLVQRLTTLFKPVAPSIQISANKSNLTFDKSSLLPSYPHANYKEVFWQHQGVQLVSESKPNGFNSIRVNSYAQDENTVTEERYSSIFKKIPVDKYQGREFIIQIWMKVLNSGDESFLWARIDSDNNSTTTYFNNRNDSPITSVSWKKYTLNGRFDSTSKFLFFGGYTVKEGTFYIDKVSLSLVGTGEKQEVIYQNDFEESNNGNIDFSKGIGDGLSSGKDGSLNLVKTNPPFDKCIEVCLSNTLSWNRQNPLFSSKLKIGDYISSPKDDKIKFNIPLCLLSDSFQTFPKADTGAFLLLNQNLGETDTDSNTIFTRIAAIVIYHSVMENFYPYLNHANHNLHTAFRKSLNESLKELDATQFLNVLRKYSSYLNDGHSIVYSTNNSISPNFYPEFCWEWIEDKLVVTKSFNDSLAIRPGYLIKRINNESPQSFFNNYKQFISAPTVGWLNYRLSHATLGGTLTDTLKLECIDLQGNKQTINIKRTLPYFRYLAMTKSKTKVVRIKPNMCYINMNQMSMHEIDSVLQKIPDVKSIICDLRGSPNFNHKFLQYLLTNDDSINTWINIPQIIYPNYQNVTYDSKGWLLKRKEPHLNVKTVFIIDASIISYGESFVGFISHYKLGTLIGQNTAGTNGNINVVALPGGYFAQFTGAYVKKLDGTDLHSVGFNPDINIRKTINGVKSGKDEFIEAAIRLLER